MVEKVDVLNETHTQLTLTSMPTPLASCSNSTDVYVVDLASGRIAKIDVSDTVTYTATTAKTGYLNYYCSGTTMYFTGRGAKVLKLDVTTGTQTEINLTTILDNDLTYKVFYLSNYIYIFSQTSAVYFARIPTADFQLSAVEQYFLYNDIGNIRSRFWMDATTVYLAESRSGYMNKFTGVLLDQQVTRDVQKEIGSGFVERIVNEDGTTQLKTADGEKFIFDAEKNLVSVSPIMTGVATLNGSTNNTVQLTDIVTTLGLEIGDVIRIEYSGYNKLHTVETIIDNSSIMVNYEHAGNRGNGSLKLADETAPVTIKRITKWYNAPTGLGQAWVNVKNFRTMGSTYTNTTGRSIEVSTVIIGSDAGVSLIVDGIIIVRYDLPGGIPTLGMSVYGSVPDGSQYSIIQAGGTYLHTTEMR